jgi:hypothetical protein
VSATVVVVGEGFAVVVGGAVVMDGAGEDVVAVGGFVVGDEDGVVAVVFPQPASNNPLTIMVTSKTNTNLFIVSSYVC